MREEYWYYSFWLVVVGSWIVGFAYGKWLGGYGGLFSELGRAISVPLPGRLELWQPILYFTLTPVAAFVLSQLFFGAGAAFFLFARGVYDSGLITILETAISNWRLTSITSAELWSFFFIMIILVVNLPLSLWAAQLGTQRSVRMLYRLRGRPTKPAAGPELISSLIIIVTLSLVAGLTATFAISSA
ncbi:MAG: hypothetical protein ACP5PX_02285 [Candidatus Hadarchaeum sp.]|uniref:hypothetical protein n=1 Tax=Candidatus Hadarchaeum sp. TaxID=2883567 RepID=UPI003D14ED38